jgi:hypothetical protein
MAGIVVELMEMSALAGRLPLRGDRLSGIAASGALRRPAGSRKEIGR